MNTFVKALLATAASLSMGASMASNTTVQVNDQLVLNNSDGRQMAVTLSAASSTFSFNAGPEFDGTPASAWDLSGSIGALNTIGAIVTGVGGVTTYVTFTTVDSEDVRTGLQLSLDTSAVTLDEQTGLLTEFATNRGMTFLAPFTVGTATGGYSNISNLRLDLVNKTISGDVSGQLLNQDGSYGPEISQQDLVMWTIQDIAGPTVLPVAALLASSDDAIEAAGFSVDPQANGDVRYTAVHEFQTLQITEGGLTFLRQTLGMTQAGTGSHALSQVNDVVGGWGSIRQTTTFTVPQLTPAIPEPGTVAMSLCGLAFGGALAWRRARR